MKTSITASFGILSTAITIGSFLFGYLLEFFITCMVLAFLSLLIWRIQPTDLVGPENVRHSPFFTLAFAFLSVVSAVVLAVPLFFNQPDKRPPPNEPRTEVPRSYVEEDFSVDKIEGNLGATLLAVRATNPRTGRVFYGLRANKVSTDGLLYNIGIRTGDIISEANSNVVSSKEDLSEAFKNSVVLKKRSILLYIWKGDDDNFVTLELR